MRQTSIATLGSRRKLHRLNYRIYSGDHSAAKLARPVTLLNWKDRDAHNVVHSAIGPLKHSHVPKFAVSDERRSTRGSLTDVFHDARACVDPGSDGTLESE